MNLTEKQNNFLRKRRQLVSAWSYVGPLLLLGIIGFALFGYVNLPLLMNPYEVLSSIEKGKLERSSLELMALLVPIMFILVSFLLVVLVLMAYGAFLNEKKYLEILEKTKQNSAETNEQ